METINAPVGLEEWIPTQEGDKFFLVSPNDNQKKLPLTEKQWEQITPSKM